MTEYRMLHGRHPVTVFLGALSLALVSSPFTEQFRYGDLVEAVRMTIVLLAALVAVGGRHRSLFVGMLMVAPALVCKWVNHFRPDVVGAWTFLVPGILFIIFVIFYLLRFIILAPRVDIEVLSAGIATYLMLGLLWSFGYILEGRFSTDAFAFSTGTSGSHEMKGFTAVYFSLITLCTVGYGDIVPVSGGARVLAATEAVVGVFYTTILIARLVTLYSSPAPSNPNNSAEQSRVSSNI